MQFLLHIFIADNGHTNKPFMLYYIIHFYVSSTKFNVSIQKLSQMGNNTAFQVSFYDIISESFFCIQTCYRFYLSLHRHIRPNLPFSSFVFLLYVIYWANIWVLAFYKSREKYAGSLLTIEGNWFSGFWLSPRKSGCDLKESEEGIWSCVSGLHPSWMLGLLESGSLSMWSRSDPGCAGGAGWTNGTAANREQQFGYSVYSCHLIRLWTCYNLIMVVRECKLRLVFLVIMGRVMNRSGDHWFESFVVQAGCEQLEVWKVRSLGSLGHCAELKRV